MAVIRSEGGSVDGAQTESSTEIRFTGSEPGQGGDATGALLPVPSGTAGREPQSLWRRFAMRRKARRALAATLDGDALLSRLDAIDERVSGAEAALAARFDQLEHRFLQLWEIEERLAQLGEVPDKIDALVRSQEQQQRALRALRHRLAWQAGALAVLLAGALGLAALRIF